MDTVWDFILYLKLCNRTHLTTLLDLPKTNNVQKKIQKKFERTLKDDLKIWETAETVPVAKTKAKVFNFSDLEKAYKLNENYLAKILQLDVISLEEQREYNSWLMSQKTIVSKEQFEKTNEAIKHANEQYNKKYKVSLEEQKDKFQDYDFAFFVSDIECFTHEESWLSLFGELLFIQKPEDMELFPPDLDYGYSYIMYFKDGIKMDITLINLKDLNRYFSDSDGLVKIYLISALV